MLDISQDYLIQQVAERFRALGDANRVRLLVLLRDGERNVSELTEALGLRQASVSKHLAVLRRAGLVISRREGTQVLYRVADESIYEMCRIVCNGVMQQARDESEALGLAEPSGAGRESTERRSRRNPSERNSSEKSPSERKSER